MSGKIDGTLLVTGIATLQKQVNFQGATKQTGLQRSDLDDSVALLHPLDLRSWGPWDTGVDVLPAAPVIANDDLGLVPGTWATDALTLKTADQVTTNSTKYAMRAFQLPGWYDDGDPISLLCRAGALGAAADTTLNLDLEVYKLVDGVISGVDLCTTAAIDINNLTWTDAEFTITPTGLVASDVLGLRLAIIYNDGAGGSPVFGAVGSTAMKFNAK